MKVIMQYFLAFPFSSLGETKPSVSAKTLKFTFKAEGGNLVAGAYACNTVLFKKRICAPRVTHYEMHSMPMLIVLGTNPHACTRDLRVSTQAASRLV